MRIQGDENYEDPRDPGYYTSGQQDALWSLVRRMERGQRRERRRAFFDRLLRRRGRHE
jgi:hypothetical protein